MLRKDKGLKKRASEEALSRKYLILLYFLVGYAIRRSQRLVRKEG